MGSGISRQLYFLICEMGAKHAAFPRTRGRELFPPLPCRDPDHPSSLWATSPRATSDLRVQTHPAG